MSVRLHIWMIVLAAAGLALPAWSQNEDVEALNDPEFEEPDVEAEADELATIAKVVEALNNDTDTVKASETVKCYRILWDAYLDMSEPPYPISDSFNLATIHAKMPSWDRVAGWAESNSQMAQAILDSKNRTMVGLPYGSSNVDPKYQDANLVVRIGESGTLRDITYPYLSALDQIAAFGTAETYRLLEAGRVQDALDLSVSLCYVLRAFCDRPFMKEKLHAINLLIDALANLRDVFYVYREQITQDQFSDIAKVELPFLRPDYKALHMPEGDRRVSVSLIREVFDPLGDAVPEKFARAFAGIQSVEMPLARFGAARRWEMIAEIHDSRHASLIRLKRIYDDWWRRWRVPLHHPILDLQTEFERTNRVRQAAVVYSLQDISEVFDARNVLVANVNGTSMAAGLAAYRNEFDTYPNDSEKVYSQFAPKRNDLDPFNEDYGTFYFDYVRRRKAVDSGAGRVWVEKDECMLMARGADQVLNIDPELPLRHSADGVLGDIILWPPIKSLEREAGLID